MAAAQDALTTCTQDLTYDSEESVALLKYTSGVCGRNHTFDAAKLAPSPPLVDPTEPSYPTSSPLAP